MDLPQRPAPARPVARMVVDWLRWFGIARLVATSLAVVAVGAGGYWLMRSPATPVESTLPYASSVSDGEASTTSNGASTSRAGPEPGSTTTTALPVDVPIVVYVAGAVVAPGVYPLPGDARVEQAVVAAGGLTADADTDAVNLAGFLVDGSRVYIPRVGVPVPALVTPSASPGGGPGFDAAPGGTAAPTGPIDVNRATAEQLDELPGVGPATAAAIVDHRESNGPYASLDDLLDVRGIGPAKLDAIRDLISV